jgi:hypothetical protein
MLNKGPKKPPGYSPTPQQLLKMLLEFHTLLDQQEAQATQPVQPS